MGASVTAGTVLSIAGVATVTLARRRADFPLALVPLLFGLQQLVEGVVWASVSRDDLTLNRASTLVYTLFSHVLWPALVPLAILRVELVAWRKRVLVASLVLGVVVGLEGLSLVLRGPGHSYACGGSIRYEMPQVSFIVLYLIATCVGTMFSSHLPLRIMGASALGLALLSLGLYAAFFVSVWCFFSAILASMLLVHFWSLRGSRRPVRD